MKVHNWSDVHQRYEICRIEWFFLDFWCIQVVLGVSAHISCIDKNFHCLFYRCRLERSVPLVEIFYYLSVHDM